MPEVPSPVRAPDFPAKANWLNTDRRITLEGLRGKIVLLDFWSYCCINCVHVLPDLDYLEQKYAEELEVIGVHSGKFDNEKISGHIERAVMRHGIRHPVMNDEAFEAWQAYTVRGWPTMVLIDPRGYVVLQVSGEGHRDLLDSTISQLVKLFSSTGELQRGPSLSLPSLEKEDTRAGLYFPGNVLADSAGGRLFISDSGNHRIVVTSLEGEVMDVLGSGEPSSEDGSFETAGFHSPQGMALHNETLFVADTGNHLLRACDLESRQVFVLAGTGFQNRDFGEWKISRASAADLSSPWDLQLSGSLLFISMAGIHQIWLLDLETFEIGPYAGSGIEALRDGNLPEAQFAQPSGITLDNSHLFVADSESSSVRAVPLATNQPVKTVIGRGLFDFGDKDGDRETGRLQHALDLLVQGDKLFVADTYNHKIRVIDLAAGILSTLAGGKKPGLKDGRRSEFFEPGGLSALGSTLFVADTNNHTVRRVDTHTGETTTIDLVGLRTQGNRHPLT